jgi:phosphoesterase RecJ-like protein
MNATVIAPNDYPSFLKWLPGSDKVMIYDNNSDKANSFIESADLIFTLDFNILLRTGNMELPLKNASATKIIIDHHEQPGNYAKYIFTDVSIGSTCQLIYHFLEKLGELKSISRDIATCLYTGILTDSGSFKFPRTTSLTHRVVADLIDKGANNIEIQQNVYDTNSYNRVQLLGKALSNLEILTECSTAIITLRQNELNQFKFQKGDTEGFVNYGLSIAGIKFAAIFIENKNEGITKISFRSKDNFDVNTFARRHFDGGGHLNAAGGKSTESLSATLERFKQILPDYQNELNP